MMPLVKRDLPHWFGVACLFEVAPAALTGLLALLVKRPVLADFHWDGTDLLRSVALTVPPLAVFFVLLKTSIPAFAEIRRVLDEFIEKFFYDWTIPHLAVLSIIAGVGEEMLFRGMIQGGLSAFLGPIPALIIAGILFGLVHFVTVPYAIIATLIGFYLGAIWIWSQNLLVPIAVHALYDFVALSVYIRRTSSRTRDRDPGQKPPDHRE